MLLMFLVLSPTRCGQSALLLLCSVLQTIAHTCSSILASGISPWPSSSSSASSLATGGGRLMDTPLELGHRPAQGTNMSMDCHKRGCGCGCIAFQSQRQVAHSLRLVSAHTWQAAESCVELDNPGCCCAWHHHCPCPLGCPPEPDVAQNGVAPAIDSASASAVLSICMRCARRCSSHALRARLKPCSSTRLSCASDRNAGVSLQAPGGHTRGGSSDFASGQSQSEDARSQQVAEAMSRYC